MSGGYDDDCVLVQLRPFKHQVGGHTCVLEVGSSTICKPFMDREVWFYEHTPDQIKSFIPRYLGETSVTCDITQNRKCLVATIPRAIATREGLEEYGKNTHMTVPICPKKRRKRSRDIEGWSSIPNRENRESLTSWSTKCIDRQISRYGFWANNQPQKFIMLENLVAGYSKPCLMDLKMGRRQYGGDSDDAKRKLLESRCADTTSATLGFRLCGSQTFKINTETYTFHDKYVGRNLDDCGAKEEIRRFFHNGVFLREDVIEKLLCRIEELRMVLMSESEMFFHSASLLLLYDGSVTSNSNSAEICTSSKQRVEGSSQFNMCNFEPSIQTTCDVNDVSVNDNLGDKHNDASDIDGAIHSQHNSISDKVCVNSLSKCDRNQLNDVTDNKWNSCLPKVDMRMIDFAHVSENQTCEHDETVVFGLIKLKEVLEEIVRENSDVIQTGVGTENFDAIQTGVGTENFDAIQTGVGTENFDAIKTGVGTENSDAIQAGVGTDYSDAIQTGVGTENSDAIQTGVGMENSDAIQTGVGTDYSDAIQTGVGIADLV